MNGRDSPGDKFLSANHPDLSPLPVMFYQIADAVDYGDAPLSYGSADHGIDGAHYLGSQPDADEANQPSSDADADDLNGFDDEDGVTFPEMYPGARVTISIKVTGLAYLNVWVDWNGDGDFGDSGERIVSNSLRNTGTANISVTVPVNAIVSRPTFARFRFGPNSTTKPTYGSSGSATFGEVEDYQIKISCVPPEPPAVGEITQPDCEVSTGSVTLNGLPEAGTWTLTRYPGGIITTGTGISTTVPGLVEGTYNFTVANSLGCNSDLSSDIVINPQPTTPAAPVPGTVTNPTCEVPTGSVVLDGLPSEGLWTLTRLPGSIKSTGTGTSTNVSGLGQGTYNFTVANAGGCISLVSSDVVIGLDPGPNPTIIITNPAPVCSPSTVDLTDAEITRGSTADLIYSYWTDAVASRPFATPTQATNGTYYIKGTTISGCYDIKPVIVSVYQNPTAYAGPDMVLEYIFYTTLQADEPGINLTGNWSLIKGSGQFADPGDAKTTVSNLAVGENILSWAVTNGVCRPSIDYVSITVLDLVIPTLITPDMNGKNDYFVIKGIETLGKTSLIVCDRRGAVVYESKDYDNKWFGFDYNGNPLPDDTYFFLIKRENGKSLKGYLVIRR